MSLGRFVIMLGAVFFALYGLAFSISPDQMSLWITGVKPRGVSALVDFRATYGGINLALGIALFYLDSIRQYRAALVILIVVLLSMAVTRTVGFFVEGSGNSFMYLFLALELLGSALAALALRRDSSGS